MTERLYGEIVEMEGRLYLDYGGDCLLPYDGPQTEGRASIVLDVPEQEREGIFNKAEAALMNRGRLLRLAEAPFFEVKLAEGLDPGLQHRPCPDLNEMRLVVPGFSFAFFFKCSPPGDLLAALYNGESIPVKILEGFDLRRCNLQNPIPVVAVNQTEKPIPASYEVVKMFVYQWSNEDVRVSVQGFRGWIPAIYYDDWEEKLASGFFFQGKEVWVRRQEFLSKKGCLFVPSQEKLSQNMGNVNTSELYVLPGMVLSEDEVSISYVDWGKDRLMVSYEGFDFPVDTSTIPSWTQRRLNFYRYMEGFPVSVKVLQWGPTVEDCLMGLLSKNVDYPFSQGDCLEGTLLFNSFTMDFNHRPYKLSLPAMSFVGLQSPYQEWIKGKQLKARVKVESIGQYGDPVLGFSSLMDQYAANVPDNTDFQAQVLGYQGEYLLWRLAYLVASTPVPPEVMGLYPEGTFIPLKKESGRFIFVTSDELTELSLLDSQNIPVGEDDLSSALRCKSPDETQPEVGESSPAIEDAIPPAIGDIVSAKVIRVSKDAVYLRYREWNGFVDREHWQWTYAYSLEGSVQTGDLVNVKVLPAEKEDEQLRFGRKEVLIQPTLRMRNGDDVKVKVTRVGQHVLCVSLGGVEMQIEPSQACWIPEYALDGLDLRTEFKVGQELDARVIASGAHSADIRLSRRPFLVNPWEYIPIDVDEGCVGTVFSPFQDGFSVKIHFFYGWVKNPGFSLAPGTRVVVRRRILDRNKGFLELEFVDMAFESPSPNVRYNSIPNRFSFHIGDDLQLRVRSVFSQEIGSGPYDSLMVETLDKTVRGLIFAKELAWRSNERRSLFYKPGQIIKARVIALDPVQNTFKASIRDLLPDTRTLDEIREGEKLDVKIIKPRRFDVVVQYRDYQGFVEINPLFWGTLHPEAFFLKEHTLEATVKSVDTDKGTILFHLPELEDMSHWDKLTLASGDRTYAQIVRVGSEELFVRCQDVLVRMNWRQLSWTRHIQLCDQFFEDDLLPVLVENCEPRSHIVILTARSSFNPYNPDTGLKPGDPVESKVVRVIPTGFFVMVDTTACFLPKEELPEGMTVLPDFFGNESLSLSVLSMDEEEGTLLLTARNGKDNPLLRSFKVGEYERFKVTGYDETGILLHVSLYPAHLNSSDALLGGFPKEEVYPMEAEVVLRIDDISGCSLKVSAYFGAEAGTSPDGVFEAECCLKSPEKGVFLRYQGRFFLLPSATFSQPFEQMVLLEEASLRVRADGSWQDGLPCVAMETPPPRVDYSDELVGRVLNAQCRALHGRKILMEADGIYLMMDTSDTVSPLIPGEKAKVRVMYLETALNRVVVSAIAVRNDPLQRLSVGTLYTGSVLEGGDVPVFRTFIHGCGFIQGEFVARQEEWRGMSVVQATPIAIYHDDPSRKMKRRVVFGLPVPGASRPAIGHKVDCTIIGKNDDLMYIDALFSIRGMEYRGRLPMRDSYWCGYATPLPKYFMAVIMGLPQNEGDPYDLSAKHATFNPFYCCEAGEEVNCEIMSYQPNGSWLVRYNNAIGLLPNRELSYQVIDIPERKWTRHDQVMMKILVISPPRSKNGRPLFRVSVKAALDNPFEGEHPLKRGDAYPAKVVRTDQEKNLVVVRLEGKEAEATITDTAVFTNGLKSYFPEDGLHIRRVVITRIVTENNLPHVFAKVEML